MFFQLTTGVVIMAVISIKPKKEEKTTRLQDVSQQDVFRLPHDAYDLCVQEGLFWRKLNDPSRNKDGQIYASSVDGSEVRFFDADRRVITHRSDTIVYPNA
jgi:hypothetical protein